MYDFNINRKDDVIYVAVHDAEAKTVVECFALREGHLAFGWTDDELIEYLTNKLNQRESNEISPC